MQRDQGKDLWDSVAKQLVAAIQEIYTVEGYRLKKKGVEKMVWKKWFKAWKKNEIDCIKLQTGKSFQFIGRKTIALLCLTAFDARKLNILSCILRLQIMETSRFVCLIYRAWWNAWPARISFKHIDKRLVKLRPKKWLQSYRQK